MTDYTIKQVERLVENYYEYGNTDYRELTDEMYEWRDEMHEAAYDIGKQLLEVMRENAEMKRQRDAILAINPPFTQDSYGMAWQSIRHQVKSIFNGKDMPTQADVIEILSKRLHITVEALDAIAMRYGKEDFAWIVAVEAIKQAEQYEAEMLIP